MTSIVNTPEFFAAESLEGLVAAHPELVRAIGGGVIRSVRPQEAQVAVVVGGGTGHLPAFAGWVGPGMAHAAVCGDIFASPSAGLVESVAREADMGRGVLLVYGNYTGDAISFGRAAEQLERAGVPTRQVPVSDDVASSQQTRLRRGIAGDLVVLKVAAAAAARGADLDTVWAAAREANRRTTSLGAAFSGISLPGSAEPLFRVDEGKIAIGLGIHGEPGLRYADRMDADALADLLLDRLVLEDAMPPLSRVAVIVNGLGATSPEELYLIYRRVAQRLAEMGVDVIAPVVDNQVTSLGMAGVSLTITRLSEDLEELWLKPARSAGFQRDEGLGVTSVLPRSTSDRGRGRRIPRGPASSHGVFVADAFVRAESAIRAAEEKLGRLDAVAGDGDHGIGMVRGVRAAREAAELAVGEGMGPRSVLQRSAQAWASRAGGTSGALWEVMLTAAATELPDSRVPELHEVGAAVDAAVRALVEVGGARPGDKTIVDAAEPYRRVVMDATTLTADVFAQAADAAARGAAETAGFRARTGRALKHGEKSVGVADPGATSFALIVRAFADVPRTGSLSGDESPSPSNDRPDYSIT